MIANGQERIQTEFTSYPDSQTGKVLDELQHFTQGTHNKLTEQLFVREVII